MPGSSGPWKFCTSSLPGPSIKNDDSYEDLRYLGNLATPGRPRATDKLSKTHQGAPQAAPGELTELSRGPPIL